MEKLERVEGVAAPLPADNVDTDMIIPVSRMKDMAADYGAGLFANLRYRPDGTENPDFVLNRPEYRQARILVAGANFGCGSSREHAVWALLGFGIRVVVAESYGDIFHNNCFRMGLLPVTLPAAQCRALGAAVAAAGGRAATCVELVAQSLRGPDGTTYAFSVAPLHRKILLEGLDAIDISLLQTPRIADFQRRDRAERPWVYQFPAP